MTGSISFTLSGDGTWRIVDYKTNNITPDMLDSVAAGYRLQMELYGLTMSRVGDMIPKEAVAWFLVPGVGRSFDLTADVLEECSRKVEKLVENIKARNFRPRDTRRCERCPDYKPYCRHYLEAV